MTTPKVNKAKIRREISASLAKMFIDSGEEYTCPACVYSAMRSKATEFARNLLNDGINLSKGNYAFAFSGLMADMFLGDANKIVHNHYYPK